MPTNAIISRDYRITDGELALFANQVANAMRRDITELTDYGVTEANINALVALVDDFQELPNDVLLRTDVSYSVEQKNALRETLSNTMRSLSVRAKVVFGENTAKYRSLSPGAISQLSDSDLLIAARQVHSAATTNLAGLAQEGVTADYLDDFSENIESFETAVDDVGNKETLRDGATENRILIGNQIYALVNKYCSYGKVIFEKTSPARYNDYIIYQKEAGGLSAPANFRYDFIGKTFWWDVVSHATSYQLEKNEGESYVEIYAGSDTSYQYNPPDGQGFYRVRARNMNGFGPATEDLEQWYFAVLPPASNLVINDSEMNPGQYNLTWDAVPTATEYSVYRSVVENGQPAADYTLQGKTAEASFVISVESGKRNYFRVNTKNLSQYAVPSAAVWVEI